MTASDQGSIEHFTFKVEWDHDHSGLLTFDLTDMETDVGGKYVCHYSDGLWRCAPKATPTVDHEFIVSPVMDQEAFAALNKARRQAFGS